MLNAKRERSSATLVLLNVRGRDANHPSVQLLRDVGERLRQNGARAMRESELREGFAPSAFPTREAKNSTQRRSGKHERSSEKDGRDRQRIFQSA
jgi:hypothetical protein